jgi:hypothetical protein
LILILAHQLEQAFKQPFYACLSKYAGDQFNLGYGLDASKLGLVADQNAWDRYTWLLDRGLGK